MKLLPFPVQFFPTTSIAIGPYCQDGGKTIDLNEFIQSRSNGCGNSCALANLVNRSLRRNVNSIVLGRTIPSIVLTCPVLFGWICTHLCDSVNLFKAISANSRNEGSNQDAI